MVSVYYNEIDPHAVAWLRALMDDGAIPRGDIDDRSIEDVTPDDVRGYTHAHFFAGIGGWALALRLAHWPDDRPVWTASCPCQPFSQAGKRGGTADSRHLWPALYWLRAHSDVPTLFGEQVASPDGRRWLAGVRDDLEILGDAVGAADLCAPGVGAFHARQRLYFVALSSRERRERQRLHLLAGGSLAPGAETGWGGEAFAVADAERGTTERSGHDVDGPQGGRSGSPRQQRLRADAGHGESSRAVADAGPQSAGRGLHGSGEGACAHGGGASGEPERSGGPLRLSDTAGARRDSGDAPAGRQTGHGLAGSHPWLAVEWLDCLDGKSRPVESLAEPLADGVSDALGYVRAGRTLSPLHAKPPAKAMRLRGYGNAIVPQLAAAFIQEAM